MAKTLEAHDKLIHEVFEGSYQFEIPDYQRPYAWTTEQAGALFDDLRSAMRDLGTSSQFFLGSIVLIKSDRDPRSLVVDGQQRLTTLTILFAALREVWGQTGNSQGLKSVTPFLYEEGDEMRGKATGYRLIAREEDAEFFRKNIQEPGGIAQLVDSTDKLKDSRLRYRENAKLLLDKVKELSSDDRIALWKFLADNCSLVVISTPDLEAAYRIFSVLNNRGLDLAPIDIIKAEVLGQIRKKYGEDKSHAYAKKWSDIESGDIERSLGRDAFGELLAHLRTIYAKKKAKATLLKEFQDYVTEYRENRPIELIDEVIEPYAYAFSIIQNSNFESIERAETVNDHLSWLNRVDFKDWVPPALVYFRRFRQQPKLLAEFLELLERLTYFLLVTKAGVNERIEAYAKLTNEIELDCDIFSSGALSLTDEQKRRFVAALDGNIYHDLPKARMALVLRLESLISSPPTQIQGVVSLEHVLPQTPPAGSEWLKWFPDDEERETWTHRLANLVLLDRKKNSAASNYDFTKKKNAYFLRGGKAPPFVLMQEVRDASEWTPAVLAERQKRLVDVFKKHWSL